MYLNASKNNIYLRYEINNIKEYIYIYIYIYIYMYVCINAAFIP